MNILYYFVIFGKEMLQSFYIDAVELLYSRILLAYLREQCEGIHCSRQQGKWSPISNICILDMGGTCAGWGFPQAPRTYRQYCLCSLSQH